MTPAGIHPTHRVTGRNHSLVCSRCQRYTSPQLPEGRGLYDAGLRQPCDRPQPMTCRCHKGVTQTAAGGAP